MLSSILASISKIGYYCGRRGSGLWGEPFNVLSALTSIAVAGAGITAWRARPERKRMHALLCLMVALDGMGSAAFHLHPTPITLQVDVLPIALFGATCLAYVAIVHLRLSVTSTAIGTILYLSSEEVIARTSGLAFGGGARRIPSILLLLGMGAYLRRRCDPVGRYGIAAGFSYLVASTFRTYDLTVCHSFPIGLHWLWHLFGTATEGLLLFGLIKHPAREPTKFPVQKMVSTS